LPAAPDVSQVTEEHKANHAKLANELRAREASVMVRFGFGSTQVAEGLLDRLWEKLNKVRYVSRSNIPLAGNY